jgi:hypothetical protein
MKQVLLKKLMNPIVIMERRVTSMKVLNPISAGILKFGRQILLYSGTIHLANKGSGCAKVTHICLQATRHKP